MTEKLLRDISGKTQNAIKIFAYQQFFLTAFQVINVELTRVLINKEAHENKRLCLFVPKVYSGQFYMYSNVNIQILL